MSYRFDKPITVEQLLATMNEFYQQHPELVVDGYRLEDFRPYQDGFLVSTDDE